MFKTSARNRAIGALRATLALGAGLLLVTACGSSEGATTANSPAPGASTKAEALDGISAKDRSYLEDLYQQAKKAGETTITLYSAYGSPDPNSGQGKVYQAFEKAFPGITVKQVTISGAELFSKVDGEFASGRHTADAVLSGPSDISYFGDRDRLADFAPQTAGDIPEEYKDPDGHFVIPFQSLFGLVYNTNLVKPSDLPKTLDDLLADSRWDKKIAIGKPTGTAPTDFSMTTLDHSGALTTEQVKAVKQSTVLSASSPDSVQETAQGRHAFALWGPSQVAATLAGTGAPIAVASLPSAQILNGPGYGIVKDAPHPLAAELLGAYYLTKPAQELIAKTSYNYGTLPGASAPSGFPDLSHYAYKTLPAGEFSDLLGDFHSRVTEKVFGKVS